MAGSGWLIVVCANVFALYSAVKGATPSVAQCPPYVEEGDTLTCRCTPRGCTNSQVTVTWLNQSPASDTLVQSNVRREDNGTQFTCQMVCGGETSTVTYVLQVGYGPSENTVSIVGNSTLITDGSRLLTLTCVAREVNPVPVYSWLDPDCQANSQGSTCSFRPHIPWDDGQTFRCRVSDDFRVTPQVVVKELTVHLKYPPFDAPVISGYTPGQIMKTGDTLTCTVTGGKPLVDHVNFYCSDHVHTEQHTTQGTSVSSTLTFYVTNVTKETENVTCHCSGYWTPEDGLYTLNTYVTFYTEYPAHIVDFTLNGRDMEILTVNEDDHVTVTLQCSAYGRPAPRVYLMKNGTVEIASNGVPEKLEFSQVVPYTLGPAECEHTGNYTCSFKDGALDLDNRILKLGVNCIPRLSRNLSSEINNCPRVITDKGFDLLIVTNPPPSPGAVSVVLTGDTQDIDISTLLTIHQQQMSLFEINIQVRVTDFQKLPVGEYQLRVPNTFGIFDCSFKRHDSTATSSASVGAIIGGVIGAIAAVAIIAALAVFIWKTRYKRYERPQPRQEDQTDDYTELQSSSVSTSTQDGSHSYANVEPRPDLSYTGDLGCYVNVASTSNTYEQLEPIQQPAPNVYSALKA